MSDAAEECDIETTVNDPVTDSWQPQQQQPYDQGILTIGCCGSTITACTMVVQ